MSLSHAKGTASTHCGLVYNQLSQQERQIVFSYPVLYKTGASYVPMDDSAQNQMMTIAVGPLQCFCDLGTKLCNKIIMNMTRTLKIRERDTKLEEDMDNIKS